MGPDICKRNLERESSTDSSAHARPEARNTMVHLWLRVGCGWLPVRWYGHYQSAVIMRLVSVGPFVPYRSGVDVVFHASGEFWPMYVAGLEGVSDGLERRLS